MFCFVGIKVLFNMSRFVKLSEKEYKDRLFNMLVKFDEFCNKHNLEYSLCGGTLLGAIRHKGFIPWDDDIDVVMPRPDYERFKVLVNKYPLGDNLVFDTTFEGYVQKIVDKSTYLKTRYSSVDKHLWMDVFPIDSLPDNKADAERRLVTGMIIKKITARADTQLGEGKTKLRAVAKIPVILPLQIIGTKRFAKFLGDFSKKYKYKNSYYVGAVSSSCGKGELLVRHEFDKKINVEFNGKKFKAMSCYDTYLKNMYGDYMKLPENYERLGHQLKKCYKRIG